jgi:hypothetical protein
MDGERKAMNRDESHWLDKMATFLLFTPTWGLFIFKVPKKTPLNLSVLLRFNRCPSSVILKGFIRWLDFDIPLHRQLLNLDGCHNSGSPVHDFG